MKLYDINVPTISEETQRLNEESSKLCEAFIESIHELKATTRFSAEWKEAYEKYHAAKKAYFDSLEVLCNTPEYKKVQEIIDEEKHRRKNHE